MNPICESKLDFLWHDPPKKRVGLSAKSFVPFLFTKGYRCYPSCKFGLPTNYYI